MKEHIERTQRDIAEAVFKYLSSEGPGGMQIIGSFMKEFERLSERSPKDDPTNLKNHMNFILNHIKTTWDKSLIVDDDGNVEIGICDDETLGFKVDKSKLKHDPSPVVWTVYLIRGIAGRYAFVNPTVYLKKKGTPMPSKYAGGFLISKWAWEREGWGKKVGPFEAHEHPASGASPIPFFKNIMNRVDIESILGNAVGEIADETN